MNCKAMLGLLLLAAPAGASQDGFYKLYDVDGRAVDEKARIAVVRMQADCGYSEFSRLGPRPEQVARCNAAEEKAVSLGSEAGRAALVVIDLESTNPSVRWRLYDVVARSADLGFVEPLVRGLEREEARGLGNQRRYERQAITRALESLTYAEVKGTPAIQWRAWADAHRGQTRAQLLSARVERARDDVSHAAVTEAAQAAHFLALEPSTRREGLNALEALRARKDLTHLERATVEALIQQVPSAPQLARKAVPSA
jgi:hypothetical protein